MENTVSPTTFEKVDVSFAAYPRQQRIAALATDRRELFARIVERREKAGAVEHDLVAMLMELRAHG